MKFGFGVLQLGDLTYERKEVSAVISRLYFSTSADGLDVLAAKLLQGGFIRVIRDETVAIRFQPSNNMTTKWTAVSIKLYSVCLVQTYYQRHEPL